MGLPAACPDAALPPSARTELPIPRRSMTSCSPVWRRIPPTDRSPPESCRFGWPRWRARTHGLRTRAGVVGDVPAGSTVAPAPGHGHRCGDQAGCRLTVRRLHGLKTDLGGVGMIAFEVSIDGQKKCIAGVSDVGVASVIASWVRRASRDPSVRRDDPRPVRGGADAGCRRSGARPGWCAGSCAVASRIPQSPASRSRLAVVESGGSRSPSDPRSGGSDLGRAAKARVLRAAQARIR